ncbi:hypothetical protein LDG_7217 [Legionella drancourtii LLAP12]|uniref:Uncharacterized protein n=1 Tax=Legionella drancourtii LLAP12 TaxID=658187 RepID=G9EPL5_9GAMM|nr:hypothetical protein LDG_7217 [Legionella drancourtii LLAP12]
MMIILTTWDFLFDNYTNVSWPPNAQNGQHLTQKRLNP